MDIQDGIKEKILGMLIDDPSMIVLLKNKYINDDIWMFCIEREPSVFQFMINPSVAMCFYALEQDGHNLKYIRDKFTNIDITRKMAFIAIKNYPKAIYYVPKGILDDGLKEMAFAQDPSLMQSFTNIRPEFIKELVLNNPSYIKYIKDPDENLVCDLLIDHPNIIVYMTSITEKMRETLSTYHPELLSFIPENNLY